MLICVGVIYCLVSPSIGAPMGPTLGRVEPTWGDASGPTSGVSYLRVHMFVITSINMYMYPSTFTCTHVCYNIHQHGVQHFIQYTTRFFCHRRGLVQTQHASQTPRVNRQYKPPKNLGEPFYRRDRIRHTQHVQLSICVYITLFSQSALVTLVTVFIYLF